MFLKQITKQGVTRLYLYESYYENGRTKQRIVESLGRLDSLQKDYDDPVAHFKAEAVRRTAEKDAARNATVTLALDEKMDTDERNLKNVGYGILKEIYRELDFQSFWKKAAGGRKFQFDIEHIFRLLVLSRIIYPGSKRSTYLGRDRFFESFDGFMLEDVYRALDPISEYRDRLQEWIFTQSQKLAERDMSVTYFDCTNYYFDIGCPDLDELDDDGSPVSVSYRKRGPEKNHRPDPIVQMGLLMDRSGIPIAYDLFPGNESEKIHMRPIISRAKEQFADSRTIIVADRGLNTSDNIYYINGDNRGSSNSRDGYLYGQSVRGASEEFKQWVLSGGYEDTWMSEDEPCDRNADGAVLFRHKSRIFPKQLSVQTTVPGSRKKKKNTVTVDQRQMVYYSSKYAAKQRTERDIMIARAKDLVEHPKKYDKITAAGSARYVENLAFDKETGEIKEGRELSINEDRIKEEEKYDGYYSIVTSELELDDIEIRRIYKGLARIEDTFRLSKSDFEARPVYVSLNEHIEAHFATCFTALVLMRLLELKLSSRYPASRIISSLREYSCVRIDANLHQFVYYDEILKDCASVFNMSLDDKYKTQDQIRRLLHY